MFARGITGRLGASEETYAPTNVIEDATTGTCAATAGIFGTIAEP